MLDWPKGIIDFVSGAHRSRDKPVPQPPYFWQRPDLVDQPFRPLSGSRPRRLTNADDTHAQLQSCLIAQLPQRSAYRSGSTLSAARMTRTYCTSSIADGILHHNRCYERESTWLGFKHDCWRAAWRTSFRSWALGGKEPVDHRRPILLPLLLTCKPMYALACNLPGSIQANNLQLRGSRGSALLNQHLRLPQNRRGHPASTHHPSPPSATAPPRSVQHGIRLLCSLGTLSWRPRQFLKASR